MERLLHVASSSDEERSSLRVTDVFDKHSHIRTLSIPKIVIDIYCGDMSLAKYYLRKYTQCIAICIDIQPEEEAFRTVPTHMHTRIHYVQMNVRHLTIQDLEIAVRRASPGSTMHDVYHVHASPDCTTMSTAESRRDRNTYRLPDGRPNPHADAYRKKRVLEHDDAMNQVLMVQTAISHRFPHMLITAENPHGAFCMQPQVKKMIATDNFRLLSTNYCAAADPRLDGGKLWTMKPTHILIHGGRSDLVLPKCDYDCQYLIPGTKRHLMAIRIDHSSHPAQQRQSGHMRHTIPGGLFKCISDSHLDAQSDHETAPAGLFAILDASQSENIALRYAEQSNVLAVSCNGCKTMVSQADAAASLESQRKWRILHARYGHQSDKRIGMKKLKGLTKVRCHTCLAAKTCRKAHSGKLYQATYALEYVYTDLQEFRETDIDGNKYQAIFVDDFTDRKWCYLIKQKSQYGEVFKLWLSEIGIPPTRIKSDWGGEFRADVENQFLKICLERGIWPEKSAPYNPQQNKAERGNRTLLNIARAIMLHKRMPKKYWGYAMKYACYIDMHSVSKRTDRTPHEAWFGHEAVFDPPVFGSEVYFRHNERGEDKCDPTGHRALFLGYPTNSPGCFVQDLDHPDKPVRISNDVPMHSFDETCDDLADPTLIEKEEYELVIPKLVSYEVEAIPMISDDRSGIPNERIAYWHSLQRYAQGRQRDMRDGESEDIKLNKILGEWKGRQLAATTELKSKIDSTRQYDSVREQAPVTKRPRVEPQPALLNNKRVSVTVDTRCVVCNSPEDEAHMLLCDNCDKGFHIRCIGMSRLPAKEHGWLCNACITPQTRVSVFRNTDKQWHNGTITMQYPNDGGHDIEYDDGAREHANLCHRRWRPIYEQVHAVHALYASITSEACEHESYIYNVASWCPKTHTDIRNANPHVQKQWLDSEDKEWKAILDKGAIRIVPLSEVPRGAVFTPTKWAYKVKADGTLKSRLCLLGNKMPETDFDTSAPTPRMSTTRIFLKKVIEEDLDCHILDLTAAFLNAPARGQTYLRLPPGRNKPGYVALLLRNLYGSTHAPRAWHNMLHNWFRKQGFAPNPHDPCIYNKRTLGSIMTCIVHVDDIAYSGSKEQCAWFREEIEKDFKIDYLGKLGIDKRAKRYLGIQIDRRADRFILHNSDLIDKVLHTSKKYPIPREQVPMKDVRLSSQDSPTTDEEKKKMASKPYRQILGQVGFLCLTTRIECSYAYKELSRFSNNYGEKHFQALLALVGYIKETRESHKLHIVRGGGMRLRAWCDADWNGDKDKHLSTTGWIVFLGNTPISWSSRMQRCTAKSTAEAEYVAASSCTQEVVYLQMLLASIEHPTETVEVFSNEGSDTDPGCVRRWREWVRDHPDSNAGQADIHTDSTNALANANMPPGWLQETLRHIKTHFHFVKQFIQDKSITLSHCGSDDQRADIFTKGFGAKSCAPENNQRAHIFRKHAKTCLGMGSITA